MLPNIEINLIWIIISTIIIFTFGVIIAPWMREKYEKVKKGVDDRKKKTSENTENKQQ
jgi:lipopolysaccharide export LptBFGC system permease protein LptF